MNRILLILAFIALSLGVKAQEAQATNEELTQYTKDATAIKSVSELEGLWLYIGIVQEGGEFTLSNKAPIVLSKLYYGDGQYKAFIYNSERQMPAITTIGSIKYKKKGICIETTEQSISQNTANTERNMHISLYNNGSNSYMMSKIDFGEVTATEVYLKMYDTAQ